MSDIFDEVDQILDEVDADPEALSNAATESNFNDSELLDIMAEIENLEKEFDSEDSSSLAHSEIESSKAIISIEVPTAEIAKTELQKEIDRELEMSLAINDAQEVEAEPLEAVAPAEILTFEKKSSKESIPYETISTLNNSEISFEAQGQMILNLGFKIGDETAKLSIDPVKGLFVTMNGVMLTINQENGCHVSMENGVTFTIPLASKEMAPKKKSA